MGRRATSRAVRRIIFRKKFPGRTARVEPVQPPDPLQVRRPDLPTTQSKRHMQVQKRCRMGGDGRQ
eukprot:858594-Prymnesium_polylepis.1